MDCPCFKRMREIADVRRQDVVNEYDQKLPKRLETFAEAMRRGAVEVVARKVLKAGVYKSSLDMDGSSEFGQGEILRAAKIVVSRRPDLARFVENNWDVLVEQAAYVPPKEVLPKRRKQNWRESFGGHIDTALDEAEKMLRQLAELDKRLPVWKNLIRGAEIPRVELVMDIHC
ncbi:MAG: hypothetical protein H5T32_07625 [Candidatus Methanosuratus sp.]|nr:hypothetical protein [Candidatus Methanosuratincola sp.]